MPAQDTPMSSTVGFRLSAEHHAKLRRRADALGLGVHECARVLLIQELDGVEMTDGRSVTQEESLELLRGIRDDQQQLKEGVARAIEAVLLNTTDLAESKVRRWVRDKILGGDSLHSRE